MEKANGVKWDDLDDELKDTARFLTADAVSTLQSCENLDEAAEAADDLWAAAALDFRDAKFYLAEMYRLGIIFEESDKEAYPLYLEAAEAGHAEAQLQVAWYCYNGIEGVLPRSLDDAFKWLEKSSDGGCAEAQSMLAVYTRDGEHVPQSHLKAIRLFGLSAAKGDRVSQEALDCYDAALHPDKKPSDAAFSPFEDRVNDLTVMDRASKRVRRLAFARDLDLTAEEKCELVAAQYRVGRAYETGDGVEKDEKKALEWYEKAGENMGADACLAAAECYLGGVGAERNLEKAYKWMRAAASYGNCEAQGRLLGLCEEAGCDEKDAANAAVFLKIAADRGNADAMRELASRYAQGRGVERDEKEAFMLCELLRQAEAESGRRGEGGSL